MTYEEVHRLFVYEPETGMLRRIGGRVLYPWRGIGKDQRYLATTVSERTYYLHQLVWLYHHGVIPPQIDHRDLDPRNCRIGNLRVCTNMENQHNTRKRKHNQSGYKGVCFCTGYRMPWRARIVVDGRVIPLGRYATPEQAAAAYAEGAERYARDFARST